MEGKQELSDNAKKEKAYVERFDKYLKMEINTEMDFDTAREFSYELAEFKEVCDPDFKSLEDRLTFFKELAHVAAIFGCCIQGLKFRTHNDRFKTKVDVLPEVEDMRETRPGKLLELVEFMTWSLKKFSASFMKIIKSANGVKILTSVLYSCSFYSFYVRIKEHKPEEVKFPIGKLAGKIVGHSSEYVKAMEGLLSQFKRISDLEFLMISRGRELCTLIFAISKNLRGLISHDVIHRIVMKGLFQLKSPHPMFTDPGVAAIYEVLFAGSSEVFQLEIYKKFFQYQMKAAVEMEYGYYCITCLLYHWKQKSTLQDVVLEALSTVIHMYDKQLEGRDVLLNVLGTACAYNNIKLEEVREALNSLLGLDSPQFNPEVHGPPVFYIACLRHFQSEAEFESNSRGICLVKSLMKKDPQLMEQLVNLDSGRREILERDKEWPQVEAVLRHSQETKDKKRLLEADWKRRHGAWKKQKKDIKLKKKKAELESVKMAKRKQQNGQLKAMKEKRTEKVEGKGRMKEQQNKKRQKEENLHETGPGKRKETEVLKSKTKTLSDPVPWKVLMK